MEVEKEGDRRLGNVPAEGRSEYWGSDVWQLEDSACSTAGLPAAPERVCPFLETAIDSLGSWQV